MKPQIDTQKLLSQQQPPAPVLAPPQ